MFVVIIFISSTRLSMKLLLLLLEADEHTTAMKIFGMKINQITIALYIAYLEQPDYLRLNCHQQNVFVVYSTST